MTAISARDELAGIIHAAMPLHYPIHADTQTMADAILAAGFKKADHDYCDGLRALNKVLAECEKEVTRG